MFYIGFFLFKKLAFCSFPFFGEQCERIAQVTHQKLAMSVNRSGHSPKMSDYERFAQVAYQKWANEQIAQVTHQKWVNVQIACFF